MEEVIKVKNKKTGEIVTLKRKESTPERSRILPNVGEVVGDVAGGVLGSTVGAPGRGAIIGGTLGRGAGIAERAFQETATTPQKIIAGVKTVVNPTMRPLITQEALSPQAREKMISDVKQEAPGTLARQAIGVGIGKVIGGVASGIGKIKGATKLASKWRGQFAKVKTDLIDKFGAQLDELVEANPNAKTYIGDVFEEASEDMSAQLKSVLNRSKIGKKILRSPKKTGNLNVKEVQDLVNDLNMKKPRTRIESDVMDFIADIKAKQLDAFPEMGKVRAEYAKTIEPYNLVKKDFKKGKLLNSVKKNFRDPEIKEVIDDLLPNKTIKEMGGYRQAATVIDGLTSAAKRIAWTVGVGIPTYTLVRNLLNSIDFGSSSEGGM